MNGKLLCLQYKYGNKNNLFATYEATLELVKQYPIVFSVIPEKFKDKAMIMAFLEANKVWVDQYDKFVAREREVDMQNKANHTYLSHNKGRFLQFNENAFVDTDVYFGEHLKDEGILIAVLENNCPFAFTEDSYDEKVVTKVLTTHHKLMWYVFDYWKDHIKDYPNIIEWLRVKYELYNMPDQAELAFLKCFSLIQPNNKKAIMQLFASLYDDLDVPLPTSTNNSEIMIKVFSLLDESMQNDIVSLFYSCVKFMKKGVLDKVLEQDIVNICPIAGDILPDEAVLKYKLTQSDTDEDVCKKCEECCHCTLSRAWFR